MRSLPSAIIFEKNKLASPYPWLVLAEVTMPDSTVIRIVRNTENVTFKSNTYTAFPFDLDVINQDSNGQIQQLVMRISNVQQSFQAYLEAANGALGATVSLHFVNTVDLSQDFSSLDLSFDVIEATSDAQWITFTLGASSPLRAAFPSRKYMAGYCSWTFKGAECGYSGSGSSCLKTFQACSTYNNIRNFGGFPGLQPGGTRLVY